MGIVNGQCDFMLSRPIKYSFEGSTHETKTIVLQENGMEHDTYTSQLEEMIMKSQIEVFEKRGGVQDSVGEVVQPLKDQVEQIEDAAEETAIQIYASIVASDSVHLHIFKNIFKKMACIPRPQKSICMIDGRAIMTEAIYNTMYPKDAQDMALRWCAFFVMPSEEGQKKESGQQPESHTEPTVA